MNEINHNDTIDNRPTFSHDRIINIRNNCLFIIADGADCFSCLWSCRTLNNCCFCNNCCVSDGRSTIYICVRFTRERYYRRACDHQQCCDGWKPVRGCPDLGICR